MFKWLLVIAVTLSLLFCVWRDYEGQRKLAATRAEIARTKTELQPFQQIADEVSAYEKQKDALQKRIDIINQLKQNQKGAANAVAKLANVDGSSIDSIAVAGGNDLVINRR